MKIFRIHPSLKFLIFAVIGIIISIPISMVLLDVINHKGGEDFIHSIKSGILIPLWMFSIGILIIGQKIKNTHTQHLPTRPAARQDVLE
jgi:hypothetical protein